MKKFLLAMLVGIVLCFASVASANEFVPDTDLISARNELVIINEGFDNAQPIWVSRNPSCYDKQTTELATWECWIDVEENVTYVYRDGELVKRVELN